jgi:hypothetical protein
MSVTYLRSFRIGKFAIIDFIGSFIIVFLIWWLLLRKHDVSLIALLILTIPFGVIMHIITKQDTPLNNIIMSSNCNKSLLFLIILIGGLVQYGHSNDLIKYLYL